VRQSFDLSLSKAVFPTGQHSVTMDFKVLSQLWRLCLEAQAKIDTDDVLSKTILEGAFEVKLDYTQASRGINIMIESFSTSDNYATK
jgi:hypothetical protein